VAAFSQTVLESSRHAELMNLACKHALLRRDVAHLVFPDQVQTLPAPNALAGSPEGRVTPLGITPPEESMASALELLRGARRPVIIAGHGARFDAPALIAAAEQLGAPVITTFKAKGLIGDDHPLAGGVLGRSGTPVASWFMNESDLLLVAGASFSTHTGIYASKPIIQIDIDPLQLGKFHAVEVPVWGEVGTTLARLSASLGPVAATDQRAELAERWALWRAEKADRARDDRGRGVASAAVFAELNRHVPEDAVLAVDVGNHAYSFGRYFESRGGQDVLMSGYLGSIGFGYPAAIGAWAATEGRRPVVCVTGDGGFAQYMAELLTAVKHGMRIVHVLLNNGQLGKIAKEQRAGNWDVWQTKLHNPSFAAYAEISGGLGVRVEHASELGDALSRAFAHDGPSLVEVMCDPDLV
jgi:thiamine pyrophosphate-dependent acetolactate synthase large subunit-like protein